MKNITPAYQTFDVTVPSSTTGNSTKSDDNEVMPSLVWFSLVVYTLVFLLGTTGNGLVIWFTIKMKKTVNVIWFLNLSIADFTFSLFLPLSITYLANDFFWVFGTFMCKLSSMVTFMNLTASVFFLAVISIDCFIMVFFPVWCQNYRRPKLALFVVIAVWVLSITCGLPFFIYRDTYRKDNVIRCFSNFKFGESLSIEIAEYKFGTTMRFIVGFVIPFTIIVACYSVIALRIYRKRMTTSSKPFKVIITVIVCFFVCWFPYQLFSILELNTDYNPHDVFRVGSTIAITLAYMNSCVNPFLYVFIARDFKDNLWRSIQSIFEKAFNEES
ncbi:chemerin-like receptor 1 [Leptodactylus fuscus]|uniref:chemerin-like receptor 1 n=1 Tax=Leptodactylus fuscus TaxID=238119 RepID=UPI003F4F384B